MIKRTSTLFTLHNWRYFNLFSNSDLGKSIKWHFEKDFKTSLEPSVERSKEPGKFGNLPSTANIISISFIKV